MQGTTLFSYANSPTRKDEGWGADKCRAQSCPRLRPLGVLLEGLEGTYYEGLYTQQAVRMQLHLATRDFEVLTHRPGPGRS